MKAELDDIKNGLRTLDNLPLIEKHTSLFRPLFVWSKSQLTANKMQDMYFMHLSPTMSNVREREEEAGIYWVTLLEIESNTYMCNFFQYNCVFLL